MDSKFSKYGISAGLLGAVCYFMGYYSLTWAVIIMLFILFFCDSTVAKKHAIQAVVFGIVIYIIQSALDFVSSGYNSVLNQVFELMENYDLYNILSKLDIASVLSGLVTVIEFIFMVIFVVLAIKGKEVIIPVVSKIIDSNFNKADEKAE